MPHSALFVVTKMMRYKTETVPAEDAFYYHKIALQSNRTEHIELGEEGRRLEIE